MIGPGKYDKQCTIVRESTDAEAVIVIVFSGNKGHGFSCQTRGVDIVAQLPDLLRSIAGQMEDDIKRDVAPG